MFILFKVVKGLQIGLHVQLKKIYIYLINYSAQSHYNQQLIALTIYVNEANFLQFGICQVIAKKGHCIML